MRACDVREVVVVNEVVASEAAHFIVLILKHLFAPEKKKKKLKQDRLRLVQKRLVQTSFSNCAGMSLILACTDLAVSKAIREVQI